MGSELEILDVDLIAFENGDATARKAVVDGVTQSLRTGFVYVEHDLSVDMIDEVYGQLEAFFTLPQENKDSYIVPGSHGQTGYTGPAGRDRRQRRRARLEGDAQLGRAARRGSSAPRQVPASLRSADAARGRPARRPPTPARLPRHDRRLCRPVSSASSPPGLGVDERFFDEMLVDGATLTRAIHYPAMENAPGEQHVWAGEHADINLITALPRATAAGLQVKVDGEWVEAAPPADRAIINTGLMLERLTNGVIPPGIHRVVSSPGQQGDRYSVVQFAHPTPWTMLEPIGTCVTAETPLRFPTISSADALDKVLWEINLVEDGRRVGGD